MLIKTTNKNVPTDFKLLAQNMQTYEICGYTEQTGYTQVLDIPSGFEQRIFPYDRYGKYLTAEEITKFALIESGELFKKMDSIAFAGQIATKDLIRADTLTKEQMLKLIDVYPHYEVGKAYAIGNILTYDGNMFEVIQAHTSQADWIPSTTLSLYKNKTPSVVIPNWVQPIGSTDAYKISDKVVFNTKVYESIINANVWSPTAYPQGWKLI